jgi:hypothetical protein
MDKKIKKYPGRRAKFEAMLVFLDEPQVMTLKYGNTRVIAVAVPDDDPDKDLFYATSVSRRDWNKYLNESVDLRYLFTYPDQRNAFTFNLNKMEDGEVYLHRYTEKAPEKYLPSPRFFASNHTEDFDHVEKPEDTTTLYVDGEWELVEFGHFNQRYSDVYAYLVTMERWGDPKTSLQVKQQIRRPFMERPFQGGFSYVHLFSNLNDNVPPSEQVSLDKIKYASPGHVDLLGKKEAFRGVHDVISNFIKNRSEIVRQYNTLYNYLSQNKYLKMSGESYGNNNPIDHFINHEAQKLYELMLAGDFSIIQTLTDRNALVSAKIVLSFYRRLAELAAFFLEGRASFAR